MRIESTGLAATHSLQRPSWHAEHATQRRSRQALAQHVGEMHARPIALRVTPLASTHPQLALRAPARVRELVHHAREGVPAWLSQQALNAGIAVRFGLPRDTWNGMSTETFVIGGKHGAPRTVHLLPPGLHATSAHEAYQHFAWNDGRRALWQRLEAVAPQLHALGVTHVAGAGSFFTTDFATPGDMDLIAFAARAPQHQSGALWFAQLNRQQGDSGVHVYWHSESFLFAGGPSVLASSFRRAPPHPRPARLTLNPFAPQGPEVGLVLMPVADLLRRTR